jgi:8-oxo-dGTP pyrophosphatase MutT (NUDIX family)
MWDLVGGHVERNEGVRQALERELMEEVGLSLLKAEKIAEIDFTAEAGEPLTYHVFDVLSAGEPVLANAEHTELRWFSFEEARALPDLASDRYRPHLVERSCLIEPPPRAWLPFRQAGP